MKTFLFGVVVGALVCFGVIRVTDPQIARDSSTERLMVGSVTPSYPHTVPPSSAASEETLAVSAGAQSVVQPPAAESGPAAEPPSVAPKPRTDWIERLSPQEANEVCTRASQLQQAREKAAKDAEPKDAGWAYSMDN